MNTEFEDKQDMLDGNFSKTIEWKRRTSLQILNLDDHHYYQINQFHLSTNL